MNRLMILPNLYTGDDNDIWRAAMSSGWKIE